MLKKISSLGSGLSKKELKTINGSAANICETFISLDGRLCICKGWIPNGSGGCRPL